MSITLTPKALEQVKKRSGRGRHLVIDYFSHHGCCSVLEEFNLYWMGAKELEKASRKFVSLRSQEGEVLFAHREIVPVLEKVAFLLDYHWLRSFNVVEPSSKLMRELLY